MSELPEVIVEFLDSASNCPQPENCSVCGTKMRYRDSIFIFRERQWKVRLPICPVCNSEISFAA